MAGRPRTTRYTEHRLEAYLKALGINQTEFARRAGISTSYLSDVMAGKTPISAGLVAKVVAATGLPESALFVRAPAAPEVVTPTMLATALIREALDLLAAEHGAPSA